MEVGAVLGAVGVVLGIAAALGAAIAVLKANVAKNTAALWREEAEALRSRLETVEEGEKGCKERLAAVEAANRVLSDQVTGATAVSNLAKKVDEHHTDVLKQLDVIGKAVNRRTRSRS